MFRYIAYTITMLCAELTFGHHWVSETYDESSLVSVELVIREFRFINPHPFASATLSSAPDSSDIWTLEMDNRWELAALGFTEDTLHRGDTILIQANPSPFDDRALYVRSIEHQRLGFRYEHNVRELYRLAPAD